MTLEGAIKVSTNKDIADYLGGLPEEKMHCSVLGQQALEQAIANCKGAPAKEPGEEIVCECFGVTDREIEKLSRENQLTTVEEVTNYTQKQVAGVRIVTKKLKGIIERVYERKESEASNEQNQES